MVRGIGTERYYHKIEFNDQVYIGIALNKKLYNGNNGKIKGRTYFNVKKNVDILQSKLKLMQYCEMINH